MRQAGVVGALCAGFLAATWMPAHGEEPPTLVWPPEIELTTRKALEATAPILVRVHLTVALEAAVGQLAQQRGTRPEVRRLGRLVAADMARADKALVVYTREKHQLNLAEVTRIVDHTEALRRHVDEVRVQLQSLSGEAFDERFLTMMSQMPQEALEVLGEGWQMVHEPRLRAELNRIALMMEQHREIADSLRSARRTRG